MSYYRVFWKNYPLKTTRINATNLNTMDIGISNAYPVILYSNDAGASGTITLNDNVENYQFIDIIIWDFYITRVYDLNNRPVGLMKISGYGEPLFEWFSESINLSGNTITRGGVTHGIEIPSSQSTTIDTTTHIPIRAVIGYKY